MGIKAYSNFSTKVTPQSEPIFGSSQVKNSAGGYSWEVNDWKRLDRFLILGSESPSYYASEREMTLKAAEAVMRCIQTDGYRVLARVVEISVAGRAPKNDPALFVLAMCAAFGDNNTKMAAGGALQEVARIGTHLLHFVQFCQNMRGWGRSLRNTVGRWYNNQSPKDLAYNLIKYQSRDGWSNKDVLILSHPKPATAVHNDLYHWVINGWDSVGDEPHPDEALRIVWAMEKAKRATDAREVMRLIQDYNLPREAIPTEWLSNPIVWDALLTKMPITATIRNLATLTRLEVIKPMHYSLNLVVDRITNQETLVKGRVHPIQILAAAITYGNGKGDKGTNTWTPLPQIVDALDKAFYLSFGSVQASGKRTMLCLDVSGSMSGGAVAGVTGLTPRVASAAMALVTANVEPAYHIMAFAGELVPISISPRQRIDDVIKATDSLPFGRTDCSLPMVYALKNKIPVDTFVVYTDSETWYGPIHPMQALQQYRREMGIPAKLVVVGMVSNGFTIADPNDGGCMDVVGFDTAAPQLISDFSAGLV